jgi:3-phosphoshikimate 1-carboxyvinyltransferase
VSALVLDPTGLRSARWTPPLSKSDAQRALVLAHVLGRPLEEVALDDEGTLPRDVLTTREGLRTLQHGAQGWQHIDCRDGGAPFRLLVTQVALSPGMKVRLTGTPRLGERPHGPLFEALREALGPCGLVLREGKPWPLEVEAPARTGAPRFRVESKESSQYPSSLLFGAALLHRREGRPWRVELSGPLASEAYLEMTLWWLGRGGFQVRREEAAFEVTALTPPRAFPEVPGDWSSLGYLLPIAWRTGGSVARADESALHPDKAVTRILQEVGLALETIGPKTLAVRGEPSRGLRASGEECPDLLPTLAALALVLPAPSVLDEVGILRAKESDRLAGIQALVAAGGGRSTLEGDTLTLYPPATLPRTLEFHSHDDHRMAMSAATLAVLTGATLTLHEPDCVSKSFPDFWNQLASAGASLRRVEIRQR